MWAVGALPFVPSCYESIARDRRDTALGSTLWRCAPTVETEVATEQMYTASAQFIGSARSSR